MADCSDGNVCQFAPDGSHTVFAGGVSNPYEVVFNSAGDLFVANGFDGSITRITSAGVQTISFTNCDLRLR